MYAMTGPCTSSGLLLSTVSTGKMWFLNIFCILNIFCTSNIFSKQNMNPTNYGTDQEKLWKKLVEFQAYNDRVMELLARLGNHIKIIFR